MGGLNAIHSLSESPTGHLLVCDDAQIWTTSGDRIDIIMNGIEKIFDIAMQSDFSFYNRNLQALEQFKRLPVPVKKLTEKKDFSKLDSYGIQIVSSNNKIIMRKIHTKFNEVKRKVVSETVSLQL